MTLRRNFLHRIAHRSARCRQKQTPRLSNSLSRSAPQGVRPDRAFVSVSSLVVDTDAAMTEAQLLRAVPEASKKIVSVHQLSRQIQFLNDGGALKVGANFSPATDGYVLTLTSRKQQESHATVTVSNTGNDYTGNWRVATSYVDRNLTHHGDTLGVAYVTSPSGGHIGDVKQASAASTATASMTSARAARARRPACTTSTISPTPRGKKTPLISASTTGI